MFVVGSKVTSCMFHSIGLFPFDCNKVASQVHDLFFGELLSREPKKFRVTIASLYGWLTEIFRALILSPLFLWTGYIILQPLAFDGNRGLRLGGKQGWPTIYIYGFTSSIVAPTLSGWGKRKNKTFAVYLGQSGGEQCFFPHSSCCYPTCWRSLLSSVSRHGPTHRLDFDERMFVRR